MPNTFNIGPSKEYRRSDRFTITDTPRSEAYHAIREGYASGSYQTNYDSIFRKANKTNNTGSVDQ